ncbi:MAG: hypothetical protein SFY66_12395 [Oculatellaceae cyanobacterium bins.114]|nr:hypothetical protein [Oculatellaceae cyanobacterium bins.114]
MTRVNLSVLISTLSSFVVAMPNAIAMPSSQAVPPLPENTNRNGVRSNNYGSWSGSFIFLR